MVFRCDKPAKLQYDIYDIRNAVPVSTSPHNGGLNSSRVVLGSKEPLEMKGAQFSVLESRVMEVYEESLERVREHLHELAQPLCSQASTTALLNP